MLALNNPLLTNEKIIEYFKKEIANKAPASRSKTPPMLSILQNKLKANFFNDRVGCDLILASISHIDDIAKLLDDFAKRQESPSKMPALIQANGQYLIGNFEGQKWVLTPIDSRIVRSIGLTFPPLNEAIFLPYLPNHKMLYEHIFQKNSKINLNKRPSNEEILGILQADSRFNTNYPKLKQVLMLIFNLTDTSDIKAALESLSLFDGNDWDINDSPLEWAQLNENYNCFAKNTALIPLFTELAVACRAMTFLFENNASDKVAYEYAYKLMALFIEPSTLSTTFDMIASDANKLFVKSSQIKDRPFHDVLQNMLKLPNMDGLDRAGWHKFIKQEGEIAFPFLANAKAMENIVTSALTERPRAPKTLVEAQTLDLYLRYPRAAESSQSLAFAQLCYQYNVDVSRFNRGLDYIASGWPKKMANDHIPNQRVSGQKDAPSEGYYWVKVPRGDMRALIMGDITGCCQSIGGKAKSEQCVMDSVSLADNGIYVLLKKQNKKADENFLIKEGVINDKDFQIIGQSYVWRSQTGNICLDSIEVLKGSISEPALGEMVTGLASAFIKEDKAIKFVTLGAGGKTPYLSLNPAPIAEKQNQGYDYGDADRQFRLAKTPNDPLTPEERNALEDFLEEYPRSFKRCIHYLSYYASTPENFLTELKSLLEIYPAMIDDLTPTSLFRMLSYTKSPSIRDFAPVHLEELNKMEPQAQVAALQQISSAQFLWKKITASDLLKVLPYIEETKRLSAILLKNDLGQSALHLAIDDPDTLMAILNLIPIEERITALTAKDYSSQSPLYLIRHQPAVREQVLNLLPSTCQNVLESDSDFIGSFGIYSEKLMSDKQTKIKAPLFMSDIEAVRTGVRRTDKAQHAPARVDVFKELKRNNIELQELDSGGISGPKINNV